MKQIVTKRIYRFVLFLGVIAILLAGILAPSLLTAQAVTAPSFTLQAVVQGGLVYVTANNFPTSTTFTVTMGASGTQGIGGSVVAHFDTASTAQTPTYVFEIPVALHNAAAIDLRAESNSGVVVVLTFTNQFLAKNSGGATALGMSVVAVKKGGYVTVKIVNLPAGLTFGAFMGPVGSQGVGGQSVATFESGAGGSRTVLLGIPVSLGNASQIDVRIESGGYFTYLTFNNVDTGAAPKGVGGTSAITVLTVVKDSLIQATFNNMPANMTLTVILSPGGSGGVGGRVIAHYDTLAGGNSTHWLEVPVSLRGNATFDLLLDGPGYSVMATVKNVNFP